ncbi:MAG: exodeoxyribonuclease VII large subunit [Candidatus Cloacimonetes bacterium]|nr:exodeoxyribonuclease VII large subunit [Candidatus Cloacimonadota bacterium]
MLEIKKEDIFSVSDVNKIIKNLIDQNLPLLWVEGEVANYTSHSSGHTYFSLKDKESTIRCAFFKQYNISSTYYPQEGDKVLCFGKVDVYEKSGQYQLLVRQMLPAGIGELQIKFNALKKKLDEEGLFDSRHKKPIPEYPESIGIITSPTGAAFQDIKNILTRRFPCHIYLYPAAVQGDKAVQELIAGLRYFNEQFTVEIIIIGRGGGSQEDLFCFNDEELARTIFASQIPVISAVGHEIDFTIADFVADLRAPTPSAAAELAVPDKQEILQQLKQYQKQLKVRTAQQLLHYKHFLRSAEKTLYQKHPQSMLFKFQQQLDEAVVSLANSLKIIPELRNQNRNLQDKLVYLSNRKSSEIIHQDRMKLEKTTNKMINLTMNLASREKEKLNNLSHELSKLSPYEALKRGYGIIRQEKKIINSVDKIDKTRSLEIKLQDGTCQCSVEKVEKSDY